MKRFVLLVSGFLEGTNVQSPVVCFQSQVGCQQESGPEVSQPLRLRWIGRLSPSALNGFWAMRYILPFLNGNRNHTQHNSNGCHWPCRTWEPSLPAKILQFFVPTRQQNISKWCQENKESSLSTRHAAELHLCYTASPDLVSTCNTKNCDDAKIHSLLTLQQYH